MPDNIFEQLFKVKLGFILKNILICNFQTADKSSEGLLSPEEFVGFFHLLTQRKDLYEIMQR